jgi:hypothetical protein
MDINMTPKKQAIGCFMGLVSLGGLVSGIYRGVAHAKGTEVNPSTANLIIYSPIVASGILGYITGSTESEEPQFLEKIVEKAPSYLDKRQAEEIARTTAGCAPFTSALGAAAITSVIECVGYGIGNWLGSQA